MGRSVSAVAYRPVSVLPGPVPGPGARPIVPAAPAVPLPAYHEPAMQYMRDHPGTPYATAVSTVGGLSGPDPFAYPHQTPGHHDRAMEHMRRHPGMSYDQAVAHVTGQGA